MTIEFLAKCIEGSDDGRLKTGEIYEIEDFYQPQDYLEPVFKPKGSRIFYRRERFKPVKPIILALTREKKIPAVGEHLENVRVLNNLDGQWVDLIDNAKIESVKLIDSKTLLIETADMRYILQMI